jgi:cell division protein FtsW (lipid II flippase)
MYDILLLLHSWNRRLILILGITAVLLAYNGWRSKRIFSPLDNLLGTTFMGALHMQLLFGLILYFFLSPKTTYALTHFSEAMKDSNLRYYAMEHGFVMLLAIALALFGRIKVHRTDDDKLKHKRSLIYYTIAMFLILLMVPFGNSQQGMPLFRS